MNTSSISIPTTTTSGTSGTILPHHSVVHATNYVTPSGLDVTETEVGRALVEELHKREGVEKQIHHQGGMTLPSTSGKNKAMATIQKMRRRLTVTGASDTIDGVAKLGLDEKQAAAVAAIAKMQRDGTVAPPTITKCAVSEYSGVSKKGHAPYNPRKKNQDALIMMEDPSTQTLLLCVLDGHGEHGDGVSYYVRDFLPKEIFTHPDWPTDVKKASREAILKVEDQIIRNYRIDTEFSGTTLAMAIIRGNHITGVNIGDSRVIIARSDGASSTTSTNAESTHGLKAEDLTFDHKPDSPAEKERIIAAGGRVFAVEYDDGIDGPPRVWLGHMDVPGLAMSRSLGDSVAHMAGVISEPEFTERVLDPEKDKFVIVATDGLWEFMDNSTCVDLACKASGPSDAVDALVKEANQRWIQEEQVIDDTTVIVAHLFDYQGGGVTNATSHVAALRN